MTKRDPVKGFQSSPEIIRLAVMLYVRCPLSLRNVEALLHERGISHETVRYWGTVLGRCSPLKSAKNGLSRCGRILISVGIWTKFS
jgi:putative transposase